MDAQTTDVEALDNALATLGNNLDQFRDSIETAEPALRPAYDKEYARILAVASSYAPDSIEAKRFESAANDATPYGDFLPYNRDALSQPELKELVVKSVENSGIDPDEVLARVSEGAGNEYLERQWVIRDLQAIGRTQEIDLSTDMALAQERLQDVYAELRCDFVELGALPEEHAVYGKPQQVVENLETLRAGVGAQFDGEANRYTVFEPIITNENESAEKLALELIDLHRSVQAGRLTDEELGVMKAALPELMEKRFLELDAALEQMPDHDADSFNILSPNYSTVLQGEHEIGVAGLRKELADFGTLLNNEAAEDVSSNTREADFSERPFSGEVQEETAKQSVDSQAITELLEQ